MTLDTLANLVDLLVAEEDARFRADALKDMRLLTVDDMLALLRNDGHSRSVFHGAFTMSQASTAFRIRDQLELLRKHNPHWFDPPAAQEAPQTSPPHTGKRPPYRPSDAEISAKLEAELKRTAP